MIACMTAKQYGVPTRIAVCAIRLYIANRGLSMQRLGIDLILSRTTGPGDRSLHQNAFSQRCRLLRRG